MLTEKDYCDYDTCVALYELGLTFEDASLSFERNILTNRYEEIPRPLLYETQKWLREEKGIIVGIINNFTIQAFDWYVSTWEEDRCRGDKYTSYEDALQRGIKAAIKILKDEELTKDF